MASPEIPTAASGRSALDVARVLAEEAGRRARTRFRQPQEVTVKGRGNLLTETDLEIERFIQQALAEEFPEHNVLSEETASSTSTDGYVWVVDPLDGTKNFVSGIPIWCVNIALCLDGEPLVAATHDPNHNETFSAQRGAGAELGGHPIRASSKSTVLESLLGIDIGYDDKRGRRLLHLALKLFPGMQALRIPGSAALGLAYAACGRYDLFLHRHLYPWDLAAGILLVQEAGGAITDHRGAPIAVASQSAIAGSARAHADFLGWQEAHAGDLELD